MLKKAIVTGSEGFIGGHLTDALLDAGVVVLGVDDMSSGLLETYEGHLAHPNYTGKQISITDKRIKNIFKDFEPDVVFHLAAKSGVAPSVIDPTFCDFTNVNGSVNVLEASKDSGAKRFIFSSSSSVYGGAGRGPIAEESKTDPRSPYALQKLVVEDYCRLFSNIYNIETISLRYFNIFGPRQRSDSAYAAVIAAFADAEKNNNVPKIFGNGNQSRDFTYVENVVFANILAAKSNMAFRGDVFNIGCGRSISVNDLCSIICSRPPEYFEERPGDVAFSQADIRKSSEVLGYRPVVDAESGIKRTMEWYGC